MGEIEVPALEGKVIERKGITVGELVEQLLKFDKDMLVVSSDHCYGLNVEVEVYERELGIEAKYYPFKGTNMKPEDKVILIS